MPQGRPVSILERLRQRIRQLRADELAASETGASTADAEVSAYLAHIRDHADIYGVDPGTRPAKGGPGLRLARRLLRRLLAPVLLRQTQHNRSLAGLVIVLLQRVIELEETFRVVAQDADAGGPRLPSPASAALPRSPDDAAADLAPATLLGPSTVGRHATSGDALDRVVALLSGIASDEPLKSRLAVYEEALRRYGARLCYADLFTVSVVLGELLAPCRCLAIGARAAEALALVGAICPDAELVHLVAAAGEAQTRERIRDWLDRLGHRGPAEVLAGDLDDPPGAIGRAGAASFDVIAVDLDADSRRLAAGLRRLAPRLRIGGCLAAAGVARWETHRGWLEAIAVDPQLVTWEFGEIGEGVAVAMRRA